MPDRRIMARVRGLAGRVRHRAEVLRLSLSGDARDRLLGGAVRNARKLAARPDAFADIEREREAFARRTDPLVDGTLDGEGPYDRGSVADAAKVSKSPRDCLLLYSVVRAFEPRNVIELGTNIGISGAYIARALKDSGKGGRLTTLEGSPYRSRLAKELHAKLDLGNVSYRQGLFSDTLQSTLNKMSPIDVAFIDGHHQYEPTLQYFDLIARHSSPDCVFIFDDIGWSDGMKKAWSELRADPRLPVSITFAGLGVALKKAQI
jgi:predicted O-methyltransferase YrrM